MKFDGMAGEEGEDERSWRESSRSIGTVRLQSKLIS